MQTNLWHSGEGGYHTYRIPALVVTTQGTLLAFCEGRRHGTHDYGEIDMLLRRSADSGATWSDPQIVWSKEGSTCGNPSPVVDKQTGTIWMLMTWNRGDDNELQIIDQASKDTRRVFVTCSTDDGLSWAAPKEITADVKKPEWTWYATGPGAGIQIEKSPFAGRLVIPCDHIEAESKRGYSHVIYSDDHGETWELGGRTPDPADESQVVELADGRLMLNMRSNDPEKNYRLIAYSNDGGAGWQDQGGDESLVCSTCHACIRRYAWPQDAEGVILFSNPATNVRRKMTVQASFDEGKTWAGRKLLHDGLCGYSDLAVLPDNTIACIYEGGETGLYDRIMLSLLSLTSIDRNQT